VEEYGSSHKSEHPECEREASVPSGATQEEGDKNKQRHHEWTALPKINRERQNIHRNHRQRYPILAVRYHPHLARDVH
jgi:hypothetical protein